LSKEKFYLFLREALERAARSAEQALHRPVPRKFAIALHGLGHSGVLFRPEEIVDVIYLGEDRFFRIIDVAVTEVSPETTTVFMRISGHAPSEFATTWDPQDLGPFKQIMAGHIKDS
jgi:hypothetical protein